MRGLYAGPAALRWGLSVPESLKIASNEIMAILLIEHIEAVNHIDEILTVPGVDLIFVGPGDLSASMGLLGQMTHTRAEGAMQKVLLPQRKRKCQRVSWQSPLPTREGGYGKVSSSSWSEWIWVSSPQERRVYLGRSKDDPARRRGQALIENIKLHRPKF